MTALARALKNTVALTLAEALSKGMNFIFIAILARQLTPSDFGGYQTIMSLVWFLGPLADLGISQVLIREIAVDRSKAPRLLTHALLLTGGLSGLAGVILLAVAYLARYPDALRPLIALSALAVVGNTLTQTAGSVLRGLERMEIQAILNSGLLLLASITGIILAFTGFGLAAQVVAAMLFTLAGAILTIGVLRQRFIPLSAAESRTWDFDLRLCRNLLRMALPIAVLMAYGVLLRWSDTLILGQARSMEEVAIYSTAQKIIDLAMIVISSASAALFPLLSSRWRESVQATQSLYLHSLRFFAAFGVAAAIGLAILAEPIAVTLFGAQYRLTAIPLRWLACAFFLQVVSGPMGTMLLASGDRLKRVVPAMGGIVLGNILLNILLAPVWGYMGAAVVFLLTSVGTFTVRQWAAYLFFERPPRLLPILIRPLLAGLAMGIVLLILRPFSIAISIPAGALIFILVLALLGELKEEPYRGLGILLQRLAEAKLAGRIKS